MAWLIQLVGQGATMYGQVEHGRASEKIALTAAAQQRQNAGQVEAAAQREAEKRREAARLVSSRVQALAGGGAGDESVVRTMADISAEGELQALTSLYNGATEAKEMRERADAGIIDSRNAKRASDFMATATAFNAGSSLYSKYGGGGPAKMTDRSSFRSDDPYKSPDYFGGEEGE